MGSIPNWVGEFHSRPVSARDGWELREGEHCFLCDAPMDGPAVFWAGAVEHTDSGCRPVTLVLHARCAGELAARLAAEAFDATTGFDMGHEGCWARLLQRAGENWRRLLNRERIAATRFKEGIAAKEVGATLLSASEYGTATGPNGELLFVWCASEGEQQCGKCGRAIPEGQLWSETCQCPGDHDPVCQTCRPLHWDETTPIRDKESTR